MNHFLDIGANQGQTFDWFLTKHPEFDGWKIWCFEPSPRHFHNLIIAAKNHRDRYAIVLCPFGFGSPARLAAIYEKAAPDPSSALGDSLYSSLGANLENPAYEVAASIVCLSDFISSQIKPNERLVVKIDAEGAEYDICRELLSRPDVLKQIERLHIEFHRVEGEEPDSALIERLAKAGADVQLWTL